MSFKRCLLHLLIKTPLYPILKPFKVTEYYIIKFLRGKSILDLGCGAHSIVAILPNTVGVEIDPEKVRIARDKRRHKRVICEDVMGLFFNKNSFDAVCAFDLIEHLPKEDALELLKRMHKWAPMVVIRVPTNIIDTNPLHFSNWSKKDFKGYKIIELNNDIICVKTHGVI